MVSRRQDTRVRGYCFTLNNYSEVEEKSISDIVTEQSIARYVCYGKEVGEEGTPHLQGYIYFKGKVAFKRAKEILGNRVHLEVQRGACEQAIDYCEKEGEFYEFGDRPIGGVGKKCTMAERAARNKKLMEESLNSLVTTGEVSIMDVRKLKNARMDLKEEMEPYSHESVRGLWLYGDPGTGKSHFARENYPDLWSKPQNKWWDGYTGQKVVLLDDLDSGTLGHYLKIWMDKYSCTGEVKRGHVPLRHELFIVTSNYAPEHFWPEDPMMCQAVRRRCKFKRFVAIGSMIDE